MQLTRRSSFLLPVVLYLVLSMLYLLTIPPGESPDEPSHLQCIEQVTQYSRIPTIDPLPRGNIWWARERIISGLVCAHMPLYYFMTGFSQQVVQLVTHAPAHYEFPPNTPDFASGVMFQHVPGKPLPNVGEPAALTVLRIESIVLGLVTLIAAGLVASRLTGNDDVAPAFAMTVVAGWPQFLFMSRAINNDALATALAVAALIALVISDRPSRYIWASLLSALAIFSKITLSVSALAVAAACLIDLVSSRNIRLYFRPALLSLLIYAGLAALIILQPTLRSHLTWSQDTIESINSNTYTLRYWLDVADLTGRSGWGQFGWMGISTPAWQVAIWWGFILTTALIGLVASINRTASTTRQRTALIGGLWVMSILAGYIRINVNRFQPQFRYIFAIIPVLIAFSAQGFCVLLNSRPRLKRIATLVAGVLLFLVNVWIVFDLLAPLYS